MVQKHQDSREEVTTKPIHPPERFGMGPAILKRIYSCNIECILTGCITSWYGNCSAFYRKALQRVVCTTQYLTGAKLPAVQDLYRRCQRKAIQIVKDPSHPIHRLPHGKQYQCAKSRTKRLLKFLPPSHKTPEQVIKWLPGLFALCASPNPSFTLLLLSFHHICIVTLTISTCTCSTTSISLTNWCLYVALLLL